MSSRHSPRLRTVRRLAMQVLYQMDVTGQTDPQTLLEGLDEDHDSLPAREAAVKLAAAAWRSREAADAQVRELAPDWPTHRQPPVDRAILRLAHHEMTTSRTPTKVAINEAVELAKRFGSEFSPSFINGVLDKLARTPVVANSPAHAAGAADPAAAPDAADPTPGQWLDDALERR